MTNQNDANAELISNLGYETFAATSVCDEAIQGTDSSARSQIRD
jgi:hypothetical protein